MNRVSAESTQSAPSESATADRREILRELRSIVLGHRYDTVYRVHCDEHVPRRAPALIERTLAGSPPVTQELFRLFYLCHEIESDRVVKILGRECTEGLETLALLRRTGDRLKSRYRLDVVGDTLLFTPGAHLSAGSVYFGDDSYFLRHVLKPREGDIGLDLCTGTGVQALRLAQASQRVDAVDLNPEALELVGVNAALNGLDDRVQAYHGDLWDALPDDARYDYVVCNPPLVPVPDDVDYPLFGHGGADGLTITRRIVSALPERLTDTGRLSVIGVSTGSADTSDVQTMVEELAADSMGCDLFLLMRIPLRDWVGTIATTVKAMYPGASANTVVLSMMRSYGEKIDELYVHSFVLECDKGAGEAGMRVFDYSPGIHKSCWFIG